MAEGFEIAPALIELANSWPVFYDTITRPQRSTVGGYTVGGDAVRITRCEHCHEEIFHGDGHLTGTVRHLMTSHGYRMDGRQFDNQNNEVGHA